MKLSRLCFVFLILGVLACNAPSSDLTPTSAVPSEITTPTAALTSVSSTEAIVSTPDLAAFEIDLRTGLSRKDFVSIEKSMGDAFYMQYVGGASGMITTADAVVLLRDSLLAGSANISFDDAIAANTISSFTLESLELEFKEALFCRGWGEDAKDQAVVLIAIDPNGKPYFAGLLYARGGFEGVAAATTQVEATKPSTTPTTAAALPDPAPRGPSVYQSDFKQGWWEHEENSVKTEHTTEGYEITVGNGPNGGWSFTTQSKRSEFYVEVTAQPLACPSTNGAYGLVFHYLDDSQFRFFILWCNGRYSLMERTATQTAAVLIEGVLPDSIDAAAGTHRLGILAQTGTLSMYVDDIRLGAIGVPNMPTGDVGPYVQTLGTDSISVLFTNIVIFQPK
jgi:hypothetical protein